MSTRPFIVPLPVPPDNTVFLNGAGHFAVPGGGGGGVVSALTLTLTAADLIAIAGGAPLEIIPGVNGQFLFGLGMRLSYVPGASAFTSDAVDPALYCIDTNLIASFEAFVIANNLPNFQFFSVLLFGNAPDSASFSFGMQLNTLNAVDAFPGITGGAFALAGTMPGSGLSLMAKTSGGGAACTLADGDGVLNVTVFYIAIT